MEYVLVFLLSTTKLESALFALVPFWTAMSVLMPLLAQLVKMKVTSTLLQSEANVYAIMDSLLSKNFVLPVQA